MANINQIKTQSQIDKEEEFLNLLKESFCRKEITQEQLVSALKILSFSDSMAAAKAKEWMQEAQYIAENTVIVKKRLEKLASLEKILVKGNLTAKKFKELTDKKDIKFIFS